MDEEGRSVFRSGYVQRQGGAIICVTYRQEQVLTSHWALSTSALLPVQKGGWELPA